MKTILSVGYLLFLAAGASAALISADPVTNVATNLLKTRTANLSSSLSDFKQGNALAAEAKLVLNVQSRAGTAYYEKELGGQLGTAALMLRDMKEGAAAKQAALQAIAHLDITKPPLSSASKVTLAEAAEFNGILAEYVIGDIQAAQQWYSRAVEFDSRRTTAADALNRVNYLLQLTAIKR